MRAEPGDAPTSGVLTYLFTDIEGSTPLWDAHPGAMAMALAEHDEIVRSIAASTSGYIFTETGDGFGVTFTRASDAVEAAVAIQRELQRRDGTRSLDLKVRIGLHTGESQFRDGNYFGPPVNRAARVMGTANGGQIVVSALTAGLLGSAGHVRLIELGSVMLRGVAEPVDVLGVETDDLPWLDLALNTTQRSVGNLPQTQNEAVGDLAELHRRVGTLTDDRLVTLTGAGGVGKSRAAIEIGWLVDDEFADGVWLVELAPVSDASSAIAAVSSTLGVPAQAGMSALQAVVDWCFGRRMLLILDNCEHVLDPIAELVAALSSTCPSVTVLATSREPLRLDGELVVRIPPLLPEHGVELFDLRARGADSSYVTAPEDRHAVEAICERLDGIPLAIELAAARTPSLTPTELLDRLDDRFALLHGRRRVLERHQTLHGAVTWSYALLGERHQRLFDRLSVFAGGFDLAAAEAVGADDGIDPRDVLDILGELVERSMVVAERVDGGTRYRLLETLRQYGRDRLRERGETTAVLDRHLRHYLDLARDADRRRLGPDQLAADRTFDLEWDNLRVAHAHAVARTDARKACELTEATGFHAIDFVRREHGEWADRAIAVGVEAGRQSSKTYSLAACWAFISADPLRSIELARAGIALDPADPALALCHTWVLYGLGAVGRFEEAIEALDGLRASIDRAVEPLPEYIGWMAVVDAQEGLPTAADDIAEFTALCARIGGPTPVLKSLNVDANWRAYSLDPPDLDGADAAYVELIALAEASNLPGPEVWGRTGRAVVAVLGDRSDAAEVLVDALELSYDRRYWMAAVHLLEVATLHFAKAGRREEAVVIAEHLASSPPAFRTAASLRERWRRAVADRGWSTDATGPVTSRHEAVAFTLDRLRGST